MPRNGKSKSKAKGKRKGNVSKNIKDEIKKELHKRIEDKQVYHSYPLTSHNSGIDVSGDAIQLIANMSKSVNEGGRIGNSIQCKRIRVTGHFIITTIGNETTSTYKHNIVVRLMCIKVKNFPEVSSAIGSYAFWMPSLLQKGNSTSAFTGLIDDLYAPINRDLITVKYDKLFRVSQGYYNTGDNTYPPSMDTCKMFDFTIKNKKILKFDDFTNAGLTPINDAGYIMMLGYCFLDGTAPDTVSTSIKLAFNSAMYYEDA